MCALAADQFKAASSAGSTGSLPPEQSNSEELVPSFTVRWKLPSCSIPSARGGGGVSRGPTTLANMQEFSRMISAPVYLTHDSYVCSVCSQYRRAPLRCPKGSQHPWGTGRARRGQGSLQIATAASRSLPALPRSSVALRCALRCQPRQAPGSLWLGTPSGSLAWRVPGSWFKDRDGRGGSAAAAAQQPR